jgi:SAM-dependent methyltransferase
MHGPAAKYYDRIYANKDYRQESSTVEAAIRRYRPDAKTLLDVGCGAGGHLQYLSKNYKAEGLDISEELVKAARKRVPGVRIHTADMVSFQLDRKYDVVLCLFSSIGYVRTIVNLNKAIRSMATHLNPGGLLIIEPWFTKRTWKPKDVYASYVDDPDLKVARISTNRTKGRLCIIEMHYLIGAAEGITHSREIHRLGLFSKAEMVEAFDKAGLECEYEEDGITGRGLYTGSKR